MHPFSVLCHFIFLFKSALEITTLMPTIFSYSTFLANVLAFFKAFHHQLHPCDFFNESINDVSERLNAIRIAFIPWTSSFTGIGFVV